MIDPPPRSDADAEADFSDDTGNGPEPFSSGPFPVSISFRTQAHADVASDQRPSILMRAGSSSSKSTP